MTAQQHEKQKRRGRPAKAGWAGDLLGYAYDFRVKLRLVWNDFIARVPVPPKSAAEIADVLREMPYYGGRLAAGEGCRRIYQAMNDRDWPKRDAREPRIRFLADSLAADGLITARYSRKLCREERKRRGRDPWPK